MSQWKLTDDAANSVSWAGMTIQAGSGKAARAANNTALYNNVTPSAFQGGHAVGQFAANPDEMANTDGESSKVQAAGWQLRRAGEGPIIGFTVDAGADGGTYFQDGDTFTVTNGSVNAIGSIIVNSTNHMVGATVVSGGLFPNTAVCEVVFTRELHLGHIYVDGGSGYHNTDIIVASNGTVNGTATLVTNSTGGFANDDITLTALGTWANDAENGDVVFTVLAANGSPSNAHVFHLVDISVEGGSGYDNTDIIVASNGTVNGTATITTNATGGFGNTDIVIDEVGIWPDDFANGDVVLTVLAANGAASNGADAVLAANLATTAGTFEANLLSSADGVVNITLGGRAGRVTYECLVATKHIANGTSDDTYLPQ